MEEAVILDGIRTPFGNFGGTLKDLSAVDLGVLVSKAILEKTGVSPDVIGESIFGNVIPTGKEAIYLARHIGLKTGLPLGVPALTLNRLCGSGMEAIIQAAKKIYLGDADAVLAGGVESMSNAPYVVRNARWGVRYGSAEFEDTLEQGLTDQYVGLIMGQTAENLADQYKISRQEQDEWAAVSQTRAEKATLEGRLKEEIFTVTIPGKKPVILEKDEFIKGAAGVDKLGSLKAVFREGGTVTAGNASGLNDGAAATIVTSSSYAKKLDKKPLAIIRGYGHAGCDPAKMGIGPALAIPAALKKAGLKLSDMSLVEVNEAFAAQYLAVQKELGLNPEITNVNGGAVAIGHPLGASGARVTITLAYELKRRKAKYGVASLCIGGGQGIALVLENPEV
ncbi:acetyl-CoA C-acetyltransferase [Leptospira kirschneri]|uniref:Acetyl-CoA C-acetyltransferase n=2 Tax=Leptospira kirschneri TaxID=29507 RepID=A0A0E2B640_9LEPT|nr:acetyl-CoA C-acetyltransferase [Leptospira kirschneri]EKO16795.1 acetyl-CoA C-acetyltransferase [Leptospira kirschneri str. H1]EMK23230.1 acetyl-CoA C-acetyltransferase [Leptospira kirschneri serovar Bulgarica str. Nikolaevo]UML80802.1 acetyl-CoA C-acetyltransferase [Leptospira kirschneri]